MRTNQQGFTLVELATVIAILSILVMITIFSVGNWRQQTAENEVKSDLTNLASAMENARNFGNGYPSGIPSSFKASTNVTVSLKSTSTTSYCAEGVSKNVASVLYHIGTNSTTPVSGGC